MRVRELYERRAVATVAILALAIWLGCGCGGRNDSEASLSELSAELNEAAQGVGTSADPAVFVKRGQRSYHTSGCKWLSRGRPGVDALTESEAKAQGYTPCDECMHPGT